MNTIKRALTRARAAVPAALAVFLIGVSQPVNALFGVDAAAMIPILKTIEGYVSDVEELIRHTEMLREAETTRQRMYAAMYLADSDLIDREGVADGIRDAIRVQGAIDCASRPIYTGGRTSTTVRQARRRVECVQYGLEVAEDLAERIRETSREIHEHNQVTQAALRAAGLTRSDATQQLITEALATDAAAAVVMREELSDLTAMQNAGTEALNSLISANLGANATVPQLLNALIQVQIAQREQLDLTNQLLSGISGRLTLMHSLTQAEMNMRNNLEAVYGEAGNPAQNTGHGFLATLPEPRRAGRIVVDACAGQLAPAEGCGADDRED